MKRKNLIKFLPLTGVVLLAPTLSLVSCNEDPEPQPSPNIWIECIRNKTKENKIFPFWIGLNVSCDWLGLMDCIEWSFIYNVESDKQTWEFSLQFNNASRGGYGSDLPQFQFYLYNNKSGQTVEGSTCNFQIHFKYYKEGKSGGNLTWEDTSAMIHWTWDESNK